MSILSDAALTLARTTLETALPDTGYILEVSYSSDGQGGQTATWGTASGGTVSCRLDPVPGMVGREQVAGGAVQDYKSYFLTLPQSATITEANRFEVNSVTFNVVSVASGKSWAIDQRCILERI